jgi:hypothetical protein
VIRIAALLTLAFGLGGVDPLWSQEHEVDATNSYRKRPHDMNAIT